MTEGKVLHLLIVEDQEDDAILMVREIKRGGYDVRFERVDSPSGFSSALTEERWDLVISDYSMPSFNGMAALKIMQEKKIDLPFIIVSGAIGEETAVEAMRSGVKDYIMKGNMKRLLPAVERELRDAEVRRVSAKAEMALTESEDRFRFTFEQAAVGMAHISPDGKFLRINKKFGQIAGVGCDELLERSFFSVFAGDYVDIIESDMKLLFEGAVRDFSAEAKIFTEKSVPVWCYLTVSALVNSESRIEYAIVVLEEITERKRLESELLQSQKMEAIGRLAGGIAHDFNNVLTVISGGAELLLSEIEESDPLHEYAVDIHNAADRASSLTKQLLAFSRRQMMQAKVVDINDVVKNAEKLLKRLVGENIEIKTSLVSEIWSVKADPGQIEQVIINLAVNSRDAIKGEGKIVIETQNIVADAGSFFSEEMAKGAYVMFSISDNGSGMDKLTMERIFEPFYTTKELGRGTGLGLSMVYGIVKQSGGYVHVYSEIGKGTVFKIYLPAVDEKAEARVEVADEAEDVLSGKENILVVEDDPNVRKLVVMTLLKYGYMVYEAPNGPTAVDLCRGEGGKIDLVITDVVMPHMNGVELAANLRSFIPSVKVVYFSGYTDVSLQNMGMIQEGVNFLQKPFSTVQLLKTIRDVLERR